MISKEGAIRKFVEDYDIEIPQSLVDEEYEIILMDMRHRMTYAGMTGQSRLNPLEQMAAMEEMKEELKAAAFYNVKEELVMKELLKREEFAVSSEELQKYAEDMAVNQNTDMEFIKKFFGDDLAMLETDVKRRKAEEWIYSQITKKENKK